MFISQQQVVSEPMVVCGEGGDVFMVPTQRGQKKPKWLTHKDPGEKKKEKEKEKEKKSPTKKYC